MAAIDVEPQAAPGLRKEVSPADLARSHQEWAIQAQENHQAAMVGWSVVALIFAIVLLSAIIHRRKIFRAADAAVVSGLATGLRTVRTVATKGESLKARVLAKADEKTPPQD